MNGFFPKEIISYFGDLLVAADNRILFYPCNNGETVARIEQALMGPARTAESMGSAREAMNFIARKDAEMREEAQEGLK